ncbi:MAG: ABC transporter substrate-binding protein [Stackebrandtia sp.]
MYSRGRRRLIAVSSALVLAGTLTACSSGGGSADTVKIGWEFPQSGAFESLGVDMENGFNLYLDTHGNKLGGRKVELVSADETEKPDEALKQAERLVEQEEVAAMAGIMDSAALKAVAPYLQEEGVPIVSSGGRPDLKPKELEGVWHTGSVNRHGGQAAAEYIKDEVKGPVYAIGADYAGGHAKLAGFTEEFDKIGGKLANGSGETEWTPFPDTTDFQPYFEKIAKTDAEAIFAFYSGSPAIDFVKQWADSDAADIPLYGPNLTEGALLNAQGESAKGVFTPSNYSADLDNPANHEFVSEWQAADKKGEPSLYVATAWDSAQVLDEAIGSIDDGEEVTPEAINKAIEGLGKIKSPRGVWEFNAKTHAPRQPWYMREVKKDGDKLSNVVVAELGQL